MCFYDTSLSLSKDPVVTYEVAYVGYRVQFRSFSPNDHTVCDDKYAACCGIGLKGLGNALKRRSNAPTSHLKSILCGGI